MFPFVYSNYVFYRNYCHCKCDNVLIINIKSAVNGTQLMMWSISPWLQHCAGSSRSPPTLATKKPPHQAVTASTASTDRPCCTACIMLWQCCHHLHWVSQHAGINIHYEGYNDSFVSSWTFREIEGSLQKNSFEVSQLWFWLTPKVLFYNTMYLFNSPSLRGQYLCSVLVILWYLLVFKEHLVQTTFGPPRLGRSN